MKKRAKMTPKNFQEEMKKLTNGKVHPQKIAKKCVIGNM